MSDTLTREQLLAKDEKGLLVRMKARFERTVKWEGLASTNWRDDYLFAYGDDTNNYQWPAAILQNRDIDDRPALTINMTRQHNLQVINEAKRTRPSVSFKAVGGSATKKSAEILEGLVRHIEYKSRAEAVYGAAITFQVISGCGYWRVTTGFVDDESFEQEPRIEPIEDPLGVLLDPNAVLPDKSDMEFAFIFRNMSRDDFLLEYPDHKEAVSLSPFDAENDWVSSDNVRVAEYYEREKYDDKLCVMQDGTPVLRSKVPGDFWKTCVAMTGSRVRTVARHRVHWYLVAGDAILEEKELPNLTIPIVQLAGEVTVINGEVDRRGMTRYLRSPQQMYNLWTSAAAEQVAAQTKTPWLVTEATIEGHEDQWAAANTTNYAVLIWNKKDEAEQPNPPPERVQPPAMAQAYIQGMMVARQEMMMASGQYQAELGQQTPERSALALQERKQQSDNATYHFVEQLSIAVQRTGAILLELFPVLYDTERVVMILGEDGESRQVQISPMQRQAFMQLQGDISQALNPKAGKYEVQARVGPSYQTQRQAAYDALLALATQAPATFPMVADILFSTADWPRAGELAERFKRMVPPQALGGAPAQELLAAQAEIKKLQDKVTRDAMAHEGLKLRQSGMEASRGIEAFRADTDRLKVLLPDVDPGQLKDVVKGLLMEIMQEGMGAQPQGQQGPVGAQEGLGPMAGPGADAGPPVPDLGGAVPGLGPGPSGLPVGPAPAPMGGV